VWAFERKSGLKGLIQLAKILKKEKFGYIYDAHCNLRSLILKLYLKNLFQRLFYKKPFLTAKKKEYFKRFLLFNFRINLFPKPYKGMIELQKPLLKWGISQFNYTNYNWIFSKAIKTKVEKLFQDFNLKNTDSWLTIIPSAAWKLKRWPLEYWKELIRLLPVYKFVILAGSKDSFCKELVSVSPKRVFNLSGKTSLVESLYVLYVIQRSILAISADTGLIHAADLFGKKGIVLRGPTAFGAPTGKHISTLEAKLPCMPCTKYGNSKCKQKIYQKCMVDIHPEMVVNTINKLI